MGRYLQLKIKPEKNHTSTRSENKTDVPFFQPTLSIQRKCSADEGREDYMHKEEVDAEVLSSRSFENYVTTLNGGGQSLSDPIRNFYEPKFGHDFSQVKIHTGTVASKSAESINALAYTSGNNIVFNSGQYAPESESGRRLLAHELTHTIQQDSAIRRAPKKDIFGRPLGFFPTPEQEAYDLESAKIGFDKTAATLELTIWADPVYQKLKEDSKKRVDRIVNMVKTKPPGDAQGQRYYYLRKLKTALSTPFNGTETGGTTYGCSTDADTKNRKVVDDALKVEKRDWNGLFSDVEEKIVATSDKKNIVERTGEQKKKFYVDRSNLTNIRVHMKVKLNGVPEEVKKIKQLEDAIERAVSLSTKGYMLDIEFVDTSGPDVFEFSVSFCQWPNSGNWASSPMTLSHEVHHALGLKDRYDYIESHSGNPQMNVPMRLVWFENELKKTEPNNPKSKMAHNNNPLLNDDVCSVAFEPGPQRENCITERNKFNPAGNPK